MEDNARNISIAGVGTVAGGRYKNINVSGVGKLEGDISAQRIEIAGTAKIKGKCTSDNINIAGMTKVEKNIEGNKVNISGYIRCGGDIECEVFKCDGGFNIQGLLNAEKIDININGKCKVNEIGGQDIKINRGETKGIDIILSKFFKGKVSMFVDVVEGDNIFLENTIAKIVRGKNITIGDGCDIQVVEYGDSISVSDRAIVVEKNKI